MTRKFIFTFFFSLLLFSGTEVFAQQNDTLHVGKDSVEKKEDTVITKNNLPIAPEKSVMALDTSVKFNPHKALFRSAVLPGWGQWYNKKYWKIPIIYGALGVTTGIFLYNLKYYKLLRKAVQYRLDTIPSNDALIDPAFIHLSTESIRIYRDAYRQNIDYSVLAFLVVWGLNVVDATVDAHLKAFDVSPDIGMKIRPGFNYTTNNAGVSLVFFFKDKSSKALQPLP
ncbi:MAG: DUF5683 domain-containing protein [Ginsengibacter sp.]